MEMCDSDGNLGKVGVTLGFFRVWSILDKYLVFKAAHVIFYMSLLL